MSMKLLLLPITASAGAGLGFLPSGKERNLQQVAELPRECRRACPTIETYMADLTTLLSDERNYVARQTGQLDLWCKHRGAVTCGFESTECSSLVRGSWYHMNGLLMCACDACSHFIEANGVLLNGTMQYSLGEENLCSMVTTLRCIQRDQRCTSLFADGSPVKFLLDSNGLSATSNPTAECDCKASGYGTSFASEANASTCDDAESQSGAVDFYINLFPLLLMLLK